MASFQQQDLGILVDTPRDSNFMDYTPEKLTWHWKIPMFNRKCIFKRWIFHCHVSFRGGIFFLLQSSKWKMTPFRDYTHLPGICSPLQRVCDWKTGKFIPKYQSNESRKKKHIFSTWSMIMGGKLSINHFYRLLFFHSAKHIPIHPVRALLRVLCVASRNLPTVPPAKPRCRYTLLTSSSRASRGRKFQKKKELYSKDRICL